MEPGRRLTRRERALVYGLLGWAAEVAFTGVRDALSPSARSWRLQGYSYLWMLPIYSLAAVLFEPLHQGVRQKPLWVRAVVYAAGILGVEYATGTALRRLTGQVPWDYGGSSRWALPGGAVRLDYAPLWAAAGLALERLDDMLGATTLAARPGG